MPLFVIGASGSGKSASMQTLKKHLTDYEFFDFDDIGVPEDADKVWRQRSTEAWIQKLIHNPSSKICLFGQMVPGELVACPSFKLLKNVRVLFLDCSEEIRIERLRKRGSLANQDQLNWSSWLRMHIKDPSWEVRIIENDSARKLDFSVLKNRSDWKGLLEIQKMDTSQMTIEEVSEQISKLIKFFELFGEIRLLRRSDIQALSDAFSKESFPKPVDLFERYLEENKCFKRSTFIALSSSGQYLGYINILWQSGYLNFREKGIPEIHDFNVIPSKRGLGIGSKMLEFCEAFIKERASKAGLGVGLYQGYGRAQQLYVGRGYVPDGHGVTYGGNPAVPGENYPLDDDLVIWMIKNLNRSGEAVNPVTIS